MGGGANGLIVHRLLRSLNATGSNVKTPAGTVIIDRAAYGKGGDVSGVSRDRSAHGSDKCANNKAMIADFYLDLDNLGVINCYMDETYQRYFRFFALRAYQCM